jgi:hypothetical protein
MNQPNIPELLVVNQAKQILFGAGLNSLKAKFYNFGDAPVEDTPDKYSLLGTPVFDSVTFYGNGADGAVTYYDLTLQKTVTVPKLTIDIALITVTKNINVTKTNVIGANVQALLSFQLQVGAFEKTTEFTAIKKAMQQGKTIKAEWDGGLRTITFTTNDNGESLNIKSKPIDQAYHRQILKLGSTEYGSPGIFLERPYETSVASQGLMKQQVTQIRDAVAREIRGLTAVKIKVAPSRNPGGVYSDAAGGAKTTEYYLGP